MLETQISKFMKQVYRTFSNILTKKGRKGLYEFQKS